MSGFVAILKGTVFGRIRGVVARLWRGCRWVLRLGVVGYVVFLMVLWVSFRYWGERNVTLAFLLYLPPLVWGLPLMGLLGLAMLLLDFRVLVLGGVAGAVVMVGLMGWSFNLWPVDEVSGGRELRVFSFNRGQSGGATQLPFVELTKPDVLVFQDAPVRGDYVVKTAGFEAFKYGGSMGEFAILSKYRILSQRLMASGGRGVAARFELDLEGAPVAVYVVHLKSPRMELRGLEKGAFLYGVLGVPGTKWAERRRGYQKFWDGQIAAIRMILIACAEEKLPFVVAGDFNAASQGYMQRLLSKELTDAHEAVGWGGGYTFPGDTENRLAFGEPWLRLDKILCSEDWAVKWCRVEGEQRSQHRSLAAGLVLKPGS